MEGARTCGALLLSETNDSRGASGHSIATSKPDARPASSYISLDSVTITEVARDEIDRPWLVDDGFDDEIRISSRGWNLDIDKYGVDARSVGVFFDGENLLLLLHRPDVSDAPWQGGDTDIETEWLSRSAGVRLLKRERDFRLPNDLPSAASDSGGLTPSMRCKLYIHDENDAEWLMLCKRWMLEMRANTDADADGETSDDEGEYT